MRKYIVILSIIALLATPAMAADDRPEITRSTLDKYLKVLPGIADLVRQKGGGGTGVEGLMGAVSGADLNAAFTRYLSKNGWKPEEFAGVHAVVAGATSYLLAKPNLDKAQKEMVSRQKEIMADPNIPDAVKQQMTSMMSQQGGAMGQMQTLVKELSPAELKLLEANKDRIVKVYKGLR